MACFHRCFKQILCSPLSQRIYGSKYSQSAGLGSVQHSCGPGRVTGYKEWAYDRMDRAIHAVCDGISIRHASRRRVQSAKINFRTRHRMSERIVPQGAKSGIEKYLNDEEEGILATFC